jgi:DNA-binding response OmpR family regulator
MTAAPKVKVRSTEKIRVLIADDDGQSSRRMQDLLSQNGFECRTTQNGTEAKKIMVAWRPKLVIADLLLPEANAFELLRFSQNEPSVRTQGIAIIVMSGHNNPENVREAYQRGARDYLTRPIMFQDLLNRVVFHCRDHREIDTKTLPGDPKDSLKIADLFVSQTLQNLKYEELLHSLTQMATLRVKGLRCSVVQHVTHEKGLVLASNDKKDIAGLNLDLKKYPEIQLVVNTGKTVVIDDLGESRALSQIKKEFKNISFNSMVVAPLYYHRKIFGVLSMRMPADRTHVETSDVLFLEFASKVISLYLSTQNPETISKYGLVPVS